MIQSVAELNRKRQADGQRPIQIGIGIHFGPVVLGDIGANRLEFAVIGGTVNVASRLEALSRSLNCAVVVSDQAISRIRQEPGSGEKVLDHLSEQSPQSIRGVEAPVAVWTM